MSLSESEIDLREFMADSANPFGRLELKPQPVELVPGASTPLSLMLTAPMLPWPCTVPADVMAAELLIIPSTLKIVPADPETEAVPESDPLTIKLPAFTAVAPV